MSFTPVYVPVFDRPTVGSPALQGLGGCGCGTMRPSVGGSTAAEFQGLGDSSFEGLLPGVVNGLLLSGLFVGLVMIVSQESERRSR